MKIIRQILALGFLGLFFQHTKLEAAEPPLELNVATLEWPPYVGANLPEGGLLAQQLHEMLSSRGFKSKINYLPWSRALKASSEGEYDVLFPAYFSVERQEDFLFVKGLSSGPVGFYVRKKDGLSEAKIDDLRGLKLAVVRGYVNVPEIDDDPTWDIDEARTDRLSLVKLGKGRVDLAFMDKQVGEHIIATQEPWLTDLVEFIEMGFKTPDLYVCVPKSLPYAEALGIAISEETVSAPAHP